VVVLRATESLPARRQPVLVADQLAGTDVDYVRWLTWRGLLDREPPRRPEPDLPAAPPSARAAAWKFSLHGGRCRTCGFVHLPPTRVCRSCGAVDAMDEVPLSRSEGTIATYTVDRLAFSLSPPVVEAVVDLDDGGRYIFEVADPQPESLEVGARCRLVFRRLFTAGDVHNYFWKAALMPGSTEEHQR
jgi:uncharacterized OB-fold protein